MKTFIGFFKWFYDFITLIFRFVFGIVKYETYLTIKGSDETIIKYNGLSKSLPDIILINEIYYRVLTTTDEIFNQIHIIRWVNIEEMEIPK